MGQEPVCLEPAVLEVAAEAKAVAPERDRWQCCTFNPEALDQTGARFGDFLALLTRSLASVCERRPVCFPSWR